MNTSISSVFLFILFVFPGNHMPPIKVSEALSTSLIKERLSQIDSVIELNYTPLVEQKIIEYTAKYRKGTTTLIERKTIYQELISGQLTSYNIPSELLYITFIESKLDPLATSSVGAKGLWQFMPRTAISMGLQVNAELDERKSPEKSSIAAAKYLKELHEEFDDWTLVLAAYNSGAGNMRKAIRKSNSKEYEVLKAHLPKQTRNYISKFTAIMYVMHYLEEHGF